MAPRRSTDRVGQPSMLGRVGDVDTASQHRDGPAAGLERAAMGRAVDSAGKAADHDEAACGKFKAQPLSHPQPRFAGRARPDHRHAGGVVGFEQAARDEIRRRIGDLLQVGRIVGVGPSHQARTEPWQFAQLLLQRRKVVETGDRASDVTPDPGRGDLFFAGLENPLGGTEPLEQQATGARSGAVDTSQREPISVGSRGHNAPRGRDVFEEDGKSTKRAGRDEAYLYIKLQIRGQSDTAGVARLSLTGPAQ